MIDAVVNVVTLLVILVGLVLVHELGHFVMARRAGVKVHEFGIGFPPRAAVLHRGRETIYSLNWLPIGGFVRLEGEEGESADARAFVNQSLPVRLRILLAGVAINFLLAWVIFSGIALLADPTWKERVGAILPGSPAAASGSQRLETGDLIVAVDGRSFPVLAAAGSHPSDAVRDVLAAAAGRTVVLTVERRGGRLDIPVTLRMPADVAAGLGALGYVPGAGAFGAEGNGLVESVALGLERTVSASTLIVGAVADLAGSILPGSGPAPDVDGPVGLVGTMGAVRTELPPVFVVVLIALLSANLAVINALPLPPLDGGRVALALVRAGTQDRLGPTFERGAAVIGSVLLMALLAWITVADVGELVA